MKTIIAGARGINDIVAVLTAVKSCGWTITEVVCGGAHGVDLLGNKWAARQGLPCKVFQADWRKLVHKAGPARNQQMADYAEALIAIPGPESRGTWDMVRRAKAKGLPVYIHTWPPLNQRQHPPHAPRESREPSVLPGPSFSSAADRR